MSVDHNRDVVLRHFEAKLRCDTAALEADMSREVQWWAPQSTSRLGMPRPLVGRDAVINMLVSVPLYQPDSRSWTMHHLIADDDFVAAHATLHARTRGGASYRNDYVFVFAFRDGVIDTVWEHLDTAYAYDRFQAPPD